MISRLEAGLLGLLLTGEKTGYELIKTMEAGYLYRSSSPGAIYPALHRMEKAGQVTSVGEGRTRHYRLTEAGLADLKAFAAEPVPWSNLFFDQVLLRMKQRSLLLLEHDERHRFIEKQLLEIRQAIAASERRLIGLDPNSMVVKVVRLTIAHLQLDVDFFLERQKELESVTSNESPS